MKTPKLMMVFIAFLLFSNLGFGANPNKFSNDQIAQKMIDKLSKDIVLTDSQKVAIKTKALELVQKRSTSNLKTNKKEKSGLQKQSFNDYMNFLSIVLTNEQKQQLINKHIEQTGETIKEFK